MTWTAETARAANRKSVETKRLKKLAQQAAVVRHQKETVLSTPEPGGIDWWNSPMEDCEREAARLRDDWQRAIQILDTRRSQLPRRKWNCAVCGREMNDGEWKFKDDSRRDPKTGMVMPAVVCSVTCYTRYWAERPRGTPRQ